MFGRLTQRATAARNDSATDSEGITVSHGDQVSHERADSATFRAARLLFGGVLGYMALDNLRNLDGRIEYARSKGTPLPSIAVPCISSALLGGSLGVALWRLPALSAAAVASFFLSVTPMVHDFWALDGDKRSQQRIHFLKNSALLGAALAFLGVARRSE